MNLVELNKPSIILLCGIPASGKSTWIRNKMKNEPKFSDYKILCTDNWIEEKAKKIKKSYVEIYNEYISESVENFVRELYSYTKDKKNLIIDQTNINVKSRYKKLSLCENYIKTAVYFELELKEAIVRNCNRGRSIPRYVLENYFHEYKRPTLDEGFDYIIDGNK